jgi:quercetin dioxygenase-like cupin family protein/DNA-binding XRE family transcriptional regulator
MSAAELDPVALTDERARIGRRLRQAREAQRLTLAQLAASCGLTKGFLSKVERDQATPSVASLLRMCDALGLSIGELFAPGRDSDLVRADAYPPISFGGVGMRESLLTPSRERRLQVLHSLIAPGGGSGDETYELPIDVEFVFVIEGVLEVTIDGEVTRLHTGDALTFSPDARHAFTNPDATASARVLWVLSPALPVDSSAEPPAIET